MSFLEEEDVPYEEELLRNPYHLKGWLRYIIQKSTTQNHQTQCLVYERALQDLPRSYKIWKKYLDYRVNHAQTVNTATEYGHVNMCFERSLMYLNKMPRIWLDYGEFLLRQNRVTLARRTLNRALQALPVTQHERVWEIFLKLVHRVNLPIVTKCVFERYLKLFPERVEDYIDFLMSIRDYQEAAKRLISIINNDRFRSSKGKSEYMFWVELCDLVCQHPEAMKDIPVESILRSGIHRFKDQVGKLWTCLAEYYVCKGQLNKARDIFEEGLAYVRTVRDFSQIFDSYAHFEESLIASKIESNDSDPLELDLRLAYFERLMKKRPLLLNDVLLRQNPNNVHEWLKRVDLSKENDNDVIRTFEDAISTVQPKSSSGRFEDIYIQYALFFEAMDKFDESRKIFERGVSVDFKNVNDLADVWIAYADFELRREIPEMAIRCMVRAVTPKGHKINYHDESISVQQRLFKCVKLWLHYLDLEETFGTFETTKAAYERVMELKIATPQVIINYAMFLEDKNRFEEAFKVYERGVDLFGYPIAFEIWNVYLPKFVKRYGKSKLERARDLFEQALDNCPPKYAKSLYLMYAKLEEEFGLIRHALSIYDKAASAVQREDKLQIFRIYITRVAEAYGVTSTREVYEKAVEMLPNEESKDMCLEYAEMERKLGEIDRARALYVYASQFCDPRMVPDFWQVWHDFEVKHGNEDTFREMLRIKRSVQTHFNNDIKFLSNQMLGEKLNSMEFVEAQVEEGQNEEKEAETEEEKEEENPFKETEKEEEEPANKALPEVVMETLVSKDESEVIFLGAKERFQQRK